MQVLLVDGMAICILMIHVMDVIVNYTSIINDGVMCHAY